MESADTDTFIEFPRLNSSCPFSILRLSPTSFLIRERDQYNEFPHIYAMFRNASLSRDWPRDSSEPTVIVLSDVGVGTEALNELISPTPKPPDCLKSVGFDWWWQPQNQPETWNLATFLAYTINPGHRHPYLVMSTHCHYDHILGFRSLLNPNTPDKPHVSVVVSAQAKEVITPYSNLQENSLCNSLKLEAPDYVSQIVLWAEHEQSIIYHHPSGVDIDVGIVALVTPGHTPDSLSWYDEIERVLCVGDLFYNSCGRRTEKSGWGPNGGPENPAPIMFVKESSLVEWWKSIHILLAFVSSRENKYCLHNDLLDLEESIAEVNRRISERFEDFQKYFAKNFGVTDLHLRPSALELTTKNDELGIPTETHDDTPMSVDVQSGHVVHHSANTSELSSPPGEDFNDWLLVSAAATVDDTDLPVSTRLMGRLNNTPAEYRRMQQKFGFRRSEAQYINLAAAHITYPSTVSFARKGLRQILAFFTLVLQAKIPMKPVPDSRGEQVGCWDYRDCPEKSYWGLDGKFIVQAPLRVVAEGQRDIPIDERDFYSKLNHSQ